MLNMVPGSSFSLVNKAACFFCIMFDGCGVKFSVREHFCWVLQICNIYEFLILVSKQSKKVEINDVELETTYRSNDKDFQAVEICSIKVFNLGSFRAY